jgi:hypothetical protein
MHKPQNSEEYPPLNVEEPRLPTRGDTNHKSKKAAQQPATGQKPYLYWVNVIVPIITLVAGALGSYWQFHPRGAQGPQPLASATPPSHGEEESYRGLRKANFRASESLYHVILDSPRHGANETFRGVRQVSLVASICRRG